MQLVVIGSPESWYVRDLRRAAADRHEVVSVTFGELTAELADGRLRCTSRALDLERCDAVLVRTMPAASLEQVVFRMDLLAGLEAAGQVVVNPPRAIEVAVDKYLATARLQAAGLLTPRTRVCQTVEEALAGFAALGGDVVLKPLFGAEGRGMARLNDEALAHRAFSLSVSLGAVIYLQEFISHSGSDLRVLVVGEEAWGMRRTNLLDWRTNISRGATGERLPLTPELIDLARRAASAVGAPLAGVDLLPGRDGRLYALEVNAVPGWRALSQVVELDVSQAVLEYLAARVSAKPSRARMPL